MTKLYISEQQATKNIQVIGAPGTRKSSLIRRLVYQAIAKGYRCVFLDLKREYLQEFYRDGVDNLIDLEDGRCVRWMIGREADSDLEAMPLADGAFPDEPGRSFFFQDHARGVLAWAIGGHHALRKQVTCSNLAKWFSDSRVLDRIVKGTEHAETLSKNAAEQRQGIIGTLNHLGRALRWMPDEPGRREFSVKDWAKNPHGSGHIFLSSTSGSFSAMRLMQSMILDMALLAVQTLPQKVLFVLDEIGQFKRSPQLEHSTAIQRSSGAPIILGYHGFTQLEEHYGEKGADSIMTNPYTNIVFRTGSKRSAEFSAALLGLPAERERARESRSNEMFSLRPRISFMNERPMVQAVIPGEIQSLEDGEGFMAQAGKIVRVKIKWFPPVERVARMTPRDLTPNEWRELQDDLVRARFEEVRLEMGAKYPLPDAVKTPFSPEKEAEDLAKATQQKLPYKNRYTKS